MPLPQDYKLLYALLPILLSAFIITSVYQDQHKRKPALGNLIFADDMESRRPFSEAHRLELGAPHSLTSASRPGGGGKAARFELRQNDPDVKGSRRAEVTVVKDEVEKEMWYAYDVYFPAADFVDEDDDEVINQWYQSGLGTPSASIRSKAGRLQFRVGGDADAREKIDIGPVAKDTWLRIVVHMVHASGSEGLTQAWVNGKMVVDRKGANMYPGDLPKWKVGIYKSGWASETTTTNKRVLFLDNVRVGNASASLAEIYTGPTPPAQQAAQQESPY
ncbi:polysaccharide lyase [Pontibacter actiniarum]|uniref:Polysaccharide lyase n=2 Tax=Pontibacter actiniarum TaxID=323450 RepID=A0A1X9YML4_9BACT|nr:polysaccharide lyase [Pontibacter actiniarum]ARS34136.1 hypothetical protein CA264_01025 [Pontibacter actiniarum]